MAIKVGRKKRRIDTGVPQLTAEAGDLGASDIARGVARGTAELSRGIQTFAQGVGALAQGVGIARANVQEKKDKVAALEAENNVAVDFNRRLGELKNENRGSKASGLAEKWDTELETFISKQTQGLSPGALGKATPAIEAAKLRSRIDIQNYTVDELNKAEIQARQNKLDNAAALIQDDPTASNYLVGRATMMAEIEDAALSPEAKEGLRNTVSDKLGNAFGMGLQPSEAVAWLEASKDNKLDPRQQVVYDSMSAEGKTKLEKELRLREKTFKTEQEAADKESDEDLLLDDMKVGYTGVDDRLSYKTAGGLKAANTLAENKAKKVKAETKQIQYTDAINDPNLAQKTNADIIDSVVDVEDAQKIITYRDKVLKNPSINGGTFERVKIQLEDDFDAGKFGKKGSEEAQIEYTRQLRDYQAWAVLPTNQGKDPLEAYYLPLMTPINAAWYSDRLTEPDPIASRKAINFLRENNAPITAINVKKAIAHLEEGERLEKERKAE